MRVCGRAGLCLIAVWAALDAVLASTLSVQHNPLKAAHLRVVTTERTGQLKGTNPEPIRKSTLSGPSGLELIAAVRAPATVSLDERRTPTIPTGSVQEVDRTRIRTSLLSLNTSRTSTYISTTSVEGATTSTTAQIDPLTSSSSTSLPLDMLVSSTTLLGSSRTITAIATSHLERGNATATSTHRSATGPPSQFLPSPAANITNSTALPTKALSQSSSSSLTTTRQTTPATRTVIATDGQDPPSRDKSSVSVGSRTHTSSTTAISHRTSLTSRPTTYTTTTRSRSTGTRVRTSTSSRRAATTASRRKTTTARTRKSTTSTSTVVWQSTGGRGISASTQTAQSRVIGGEGKKKGFGITSAAAPRVHVGTAVACSFVMLVLGWTLT